MIERTAKVNPLLIGWLVAVLLAVALATSLVSGLSTDVQEDARAFQTVPAVLEASLSTSQGNSLTSAQSESQLQPLALTARQKAALIGIKSGLLGVGNFVAFAPMVARTAVR